MRDVSVQHSRRATRRMLWIERLVDVDQLSACHEHLADPARAGPGQSGHENRWSFLRECTVGHYRPSFSRHPARIRLYRPAWIDRHALVTVAVNRQSAHWLPEPLFTHQ